MKSITPLFLILLSALALILSFHPADLGPLAFIALAPLLLVLRGGPVRRAAGLSFLFGYLHGVGVFHWLPHVEGVTYPAFLFLLAPIYGLYYAAFGVSYRLAAVRFPELAFLAAPAFWVTVECARANMSFLALPWNLLGHTQHAVLPVIGIADLAGVYGISFLLVLVNEALSRWLERFMPGEGHRGTVPHSKVPGLYVPTAAAAATLVLAVAYSLAGMGSGDASPGLRVALVQPNVLVTEGMDYEEQRRYLETYTEFTRRAAEKSPDLIVWPASSLPGSLYSRSVRMLLGPLTRELDASLLVGGAGGEKMVPAGGDRRSYANTEFLLRPGGRPGGSYAKRRLVPFNEYLPLSGLIRWPPWITTLEGNYRPGEKDVVFAVKEARFGVPICWESLFPDLFRRFVRDGANLMVNASNDSFMGRTAGPYQSMAMNVFRAVENRVTLVRASATGISAFIGPDGRVLESVRGERGEALYVEGILVRDVKLALKKTFYTKHGDLFAWMMAGFSAAFMIAAGIAAVKDRSRQEP